MEVNSLNQSNFHLSYHSIQCPLSGIKKTKIITKVLIFTKILLEEILSMKSISWPYKLKIALCFILCGASFAGEAISQENPQDLPVRGITSYENYTGLSELITMICDDAISTLQGFFGPTVVEVQPFITFGQFQENKISSLGISLADQMMAMVNNDTAANAENTPAGETKEHQQKLRGTIQEIDGFLRIHISAVNVYGERLSHTTTVEMSEPIYRAMHTYL